MQYFTGSYIFTIFGIILAYFWGEHVHHGTGLISVFIVIVLSILEISLSFDNAVVNAMKLEKMNEKWRHRFLTWGILIAVFGMRFLFPVLVVAVFAPEELVPGGVVLRGGGRGETGSTCSRCGSKNAACRTEEGFHFAEAETGREKMR